MKIVVVGGGAMGMIHAALLSKVAPVQMLVRRAEQAQALNADGLTLVDWTNAKDVYTVPSTANANVLDDAELIVIAVKSYQTAQVAELLSASKNESSLVMSIQNGFGHDELLVNACGADRVLLGKTGYAGGKKNDATVHMSSTGETVIGEREGPVTPRVRNIEEVFQNANVSVEVSDQMRSVLWSKFAQACSQNGLSAITGKMFSELHESESARELLQSLADEMKDSGRGRRCSTLI